jgi:hypothetical protein
MTDAVTWTERVDMTKPKKVDYEFKEDFEIRQIILMFLTDHYLIK